MSGGSEGDGDGAGCGGGAGGAGMLSSLKETCVKQKPYPIMRNSITKILVM